MAPTLTRPHSAPAQNIAGGVVIGAAIAAVLVVAAALVPSMRLPPFVSRITVANPTIYGVEVDARPANGTAWLSLGGFPRESTRNAYEVIDQGKTWVFRFTYGGEEAGTLTEARSKLEHDHWRMTVPQDVADRLGAMGFAASAH
jgi:hypothetical protein